QRFLREKGLTIRRLKALIDIVSENDEMREDAEIIHEKYKSKLLSLEEAEKDISTRLSARLEALNEQLKSVKVLLFDAKVQFKSNEITESKYDLIKTHTGEIMEHIDHEKAEILNIQRRIADISLDGAQVQVNQREQIQHSAVSYLVTDTTAGQQVETPSVPSYVDETKIPETASASSQGAPQTADTTSAPEPVTAQPSAASSSAVQNKEVVAWRGAVAQSAPAVDSVSTPDAGTDWFTRMEAQ
ncbi:MAG: CdvA-like protein, partial [Candidatus Nitrosotenuis sp.]|nr:CdvA-like protein [Candidatus Nitrosotenuis sp.]